MSGSAALLIAILDPSPIFSWSLPVRVRRSTTLYVFSSFLLWFIAHIAVMLNWYANPIAANML